jgi:hypothetical protein
MDRHLAATGQPSFSGQQYPPAAPHTDVRRVVLAGPAVYETPALPDARRIACVDAPVR